MNNSILQLKRHMKRGLAAVLFLLLLTGASAAAFYTLAAAVSALSGRDVIPPYQQPNATTSSAPVSSQHTNSVEPSATIPTNSAATEQTDTQPSTDWTDRANTAIDHMHSPLGEAIDSGGYALGTRVQHAFGSLLSGMLKTLFVEQPDGSNAQGGQHG